MKDILLVEAASVVFVDKKSSVAPARTSGEILNGFSGRGGLTISIGLFVISSFFAEPSGAFKNPGPGRGSIQLTTTKSEHFIIICC